MAKSFFVLLLFAFVVYGQEEQKRVAILNTEDDGEPQIELTDMNYLTGKLREIALKTLPENKYSVMSVQSIVDKLGSWENARRICKEAEGCIAKIGQKINADYIGQARLGRTGGNLTINTELYNSGSGVLIGSFTGKAKDVSGLEAVIDEKAPQMFRKMPGVSNKRIIEGGIGGLTKGESYELDEEKLYLVSLKTEPSGAVLSFDGVASAKCKKTPCKLELHEGAVRIIANLEQYEIADTTVLINKNSQNVVITLKPNFGVLRINPAYLDGIGKDEQWSLSINGKQASSWENKLSPNKYKVELGHRCYEDLSFYVGINKGSREVFDMVGNITLRKGGLILSAELNGESISEPVFVNGKQAGETPFSGAVPLCANVEIGGNREALGVELKYNEKVRYTHKSNPYVPVPDVEKPIKTRFWITLGLEMLGVAFISYGIYENSEAKDALKKYNRSWGSSDYYEDAWKDVESSKRTRNVFYAIGGVFLSSGIGAHIWF
ncbi:MAG: PEGA domain-containing protein [Fibromonadaceae bacterium]|jgi:hypothetical protein|nr:PEGA domain-containing protein [Fibromonadaceae bacterium]